MLEGGVKTCRPLIGQLEQHLVILFFSTVVCLSARSLSFHAVINNHLSAVHDVGSECIVEHKRERECQKREAECEQSRGKKGSIPGSNVQHGSQCVS